MIVVVVEVLTVKGTKLTSFWAIVVASTMLLAVKGGGICSMN